MLPFDSIFISSENPYSGTVGVFGRIFLSGASAGPNVLRTIQAGPCYSICGGERAASRRLYQCYRTPGIGRLGKSCCLLGRWSHKGMVWLMTGDPSTNLLSILLSIILLVGNALLLSPAYASQQTGAIQSPLSEERLWVEGAELLVERASSGKTEGKTFTQDVKAHRARLRNMMQNSEPSLSEARRDLHMSMVLLGVLLKTASGCQSGGLVVCPVALVSQMHTVLKNTYVKLASSEEQGISSSQAGATK